jgi:hypothetical protein
MPVNEGVMERWGVSPKCQRRIICLMSTHMASGAAALLGFLGAVERSIEGWLELDIVALEFSASVGEGLRAGG